MGTGTSKYVTLCVACKNDQHVAIIQQRKTRTDYHYLSLDDEIEIHLSLMIITEAARLNLDKDKPELLFCI